MIVGASTFILNSVLVKNLINNLKNRSHLKTHEDEEAPEILKDLTLAMPLRNEEENLKEFLPLLENQQSLPEKIIFLNDQSSDYTLSIAQNFKKQSTKSFVKIIEGKEIPPNFRGKIWALKQLLEEVDTEFVLFMDADVRLSHSRALFSLYQEAKALRQGRYSFATVFPRPKASKDASLLVNQVFVHLYYLLPYNWKTAHTGNSATGCSQVMFVNAPKLREYKFLDQISFSTHDGLRLARLFKQKEKFVNYFDGGAFFQSEYYSNLFNAFKGFSRNSFEADASILRTLGVTALLFWAFVLPFIFLPFAIINPCWIGALFIILWGQYRLMQELDLDPLFIATTPVAATLSCVVHLWSTLKSRLDLKEEWHGRLLAP